MRLSKEHINISNFYLSRNATLREGRYINKIINNCSKHQKNVSADKHNRKYDDCIKIYGESHTVNSKNINSNINCDVYKGVLHILQNNFLTMCCPC